MTVLAAYCHPASAVAPGFLRSLDQLTVRDAYLHPGRLVGVLRHESSANIAGARCAIVRSFLAHAAQPEWLWMIDADMTFADDLLDRLLASAHPKDRPIVGGLCFGVRPIGTASPVGGTDLELFPTIYTVEPDGSMLQYHDFARDALVQVHSTGAACLLVHRSVLADERWQDGHPLPWFRESVLAGKVCSEDHYFCLRAGALGYPIHVDTGAETGHCKTFVADLAEYDRRRRARQEAMTDASH